MRLYHSPTSPFVRKVMVLLHEARRVGEMELIAAGGSPVDPGTMPLDQNPLGKIPALEPGDGPAIYDSRVICRYLDDRFRAGFYPAGPRLWDTLTLEATADGILDAAVLMRYEMMIRPQDKQFPGWTEGQWAKVSRALDAIETRWMGHLDGPQDGPVDMGGIATGCALGYLDFRFPDRAWPEGRPDLADWWEKTRARPSFQATMPPA